MRSIHKFLFSLLFTFICFTVFIAIAYLGLFQYIEVNFYDARVKDRIDRNLESIDSNILSFHRINHEKHKSILEMDFIRTVYFLNQSREHIFNRENLFGKLTIEGVGFAGVRFVDQNLERIHYSTFEGDVLRRTETNIEYRNLLEVESASLVEALRREARNEPIIIHAGARSFVYTYKAFDLHERQAGYALFYIGKLGLQSHLIQQGLLDFGDQIELIDGLGILLRSQRLNPQILEVVQAYWSHRALEIPSLILEGGRQFYFFDSVSTGNFRVGMFVPRELFGMSIPLQATILVGVFFTLFLLFFLIFSVKQEPILIVKERVKKLQLMVLWEYLERKQELDWKKLQVDLENRKDEVKKEILKGIGRIKKEVRPELEDLVEKSWEEIISILGNKASAAVPAMDINRLTQLVEQALKNVKSIASPPVLEKLPLISEISQGQSGENLVQRLPEEVEEVGVEELEEVEEAEEAEEVVASEVREEAEEIETVEEAEEVEALEEAIEGEAVEVIEALAVREEAEEIEAIEEAEEVEALEEVIEIEPDDEVEEVGQVEAVEEVGVEDVEEVEDAEELEVLEEAQEWGILEEVSEPIAQIPSARERLLSRHLFEGSKFDRNKAKQKPVGITSLLKLYDSGYVEYSDISHTMQGPSNIILTDVDGLVQIDERSFDATDSPVDSTFKGLVDEVIRHTDRSVTKEEGKEGIENLLQTGEISLEDIVEETEYLDYGFQVQKLLEKVESRGFLNSFLSPEGFFLLTTFLKGYKKDVTGIHKALVHLSGSIFSPVCISFKKESSTYVKKYSVGIQEVQLENFSLPDGPFFGRMWRGKGSLLRVNYLISEIEEFQKIAFFQQIATEHYPVFIPYVADNEKGIILFVIPKKIPIERLKSNILSYSINS